MAYTVKITYTGPANPEAIKFASPICQTFAPTNAYTDTPAYKSTVYDTHVTGFGFIDLMEPYATTGFPYPVPLAQFKLAVVGKDNAKGAKEVEFTVESYMEAFWYMEAGVALKNQGFAVEVKEKEAAAGKE